MKKSLLLLLVLAALVGVAVLTKNQKEARLTENVRRGVSTRELLLPGLDVNAVKTIKIKDKDHTATLNQANADWTVEERAGYPADFSKLSQALLDLREIKIAGKQLLGQGAWADENVLEPADGVTTGTGTLVRLVDDQGGDLATLILGGDVQVSGGNSTQFGRTPQRLIRIPQDEDSLWMIAADLASLQAKPEDWLDKAFIAVQDLATLSVTAPDAADSWKVSRASKDDTEFTLDGLKDVEEFDSTKVSLTGLLASASFNDVKPAADAATLLKDAHKARLTTFDGFSYDLQVAKQTADGADKYFLATTVSATLPEQRQAGADEKEEDKTRLDEEFKAAQDRLKEKLEKETKLNGWVFEVAEYTVNNLLKKRSELIKAPEAPGADDPTAPEGSITPTGASIRPAQMPVAPAPALSEPISVTTPPIAVPQAPQPEIKPAPAPDANPAETPATKP